MLKSTRENKLNALLGITQQVEDVKQKSTGLVVGVSESEIAEFREIQGLLYFLQAPALFTSKKCPHCGDMFLVSRKYVGYCSYTCIRKSLNEQGIEWRKGHDLEALANDPQVFNGNEPLWITNRILSKLQSLLQEFPEDTIQAIPQYSPEPTLDTQEPVATEPPTPTTLSALFPTLVNTTQSKKSQTGNGRRPKRILKPT